MPKVGDIINGRYKLQSLVGKGGMGEVFEGVHLEIGARVALKFLNHRFNDDPTALIRFKREARAAAAIGHDAIIGVQDLGVTEEGNLYLVMELLTGHSLAERLAYVGQLDAAMTAYVGCQVLSGLAAAHSATIVHRDLKAENIFLVESGAPLPGVKILDFGISRVLGKTDSVRDTRLTQTGVVIGTPTYMSPEQARGQEDLDQRSDLFSLGVILYECLTGQVPFDGQNYNAVVANILTQTPAPPRERHPEVPEALEAIVLKALTKDVQGRYQSAAQMLEALLPHVEERAVGRIPIPAEISDPEELHSLTEPELAAGPRTTPLSKSGSTDLWWESDSHRGAGLGHWLWRIGAALGIIGALVGGSLLAIWAAGADVAVQPASQAPPPARVPPPEPRPQPAPSEAGVVTIDIEGLPEGAMVMLNDAIVDGLPLRLQRNGPMYKLRVEAEGFEPVERMISPTGDKILTLPLTPIRQVQRRGKRRLTGRSKGPAAGTTGVKRGGTQPGFFVPRTKVPYLEDQ